MKDRTRSIEQPDLAGLYAAIENINRRLEKIEIGGNGGVSTDAVGRSAHPSLDKLKIAEAVAGSIFGSQYVEKACQFEPGRPCDHCSMCNSRGF